MFPKILYNYYLYYAFNLININISRKSIYFYIKYTSKIFSLIQLLKKINFINNYRIFKKHWKNKLNYYIGITPFYYKNLKVIKDFKIISTPTQKIFISIKALKLLSKRTGCSIYLISTTQGILTHHLAIKKNLSGFLIGFFFN